DDKLTELSNRSNLTKNQVIVWLGHKMNPDTPLYNIPCYLKLRGSINRDHFRRAFQVVVDSSDALRTVVEEQDDIPQQLVLPDLRFEMEYLDFSGEPNPDAALHTWANDRCAIPFRLDQRLFDCALTKISEQDFVVYFNAHHIIIDAWSISVLLRQIV